MKDIKIFIGLFFAIMLSASTINAMSASAGSTVTPGAAALRQRLIEAAKIDALGTVRLLLEYGAGDRINATDRYHGMTALMHACRCIDSNSLAIVNLLLEKGADVNAADDDGITVLMYACQDVGSNSLAIVNLLLEKGADVNAADDYGRTALMFACQGVGSNSLAIVNLLLENGADVDATDRYHGRTALMFVGDVENIALVELLEGAARYKKKCSWLAGVSHAVRRLAK